MLRTYQFTLIVVSTQFGRYCSAKVFLNCSPNNNQECVKQEIEKDSKKKIGNVKFVNEPLLPFLA